MKVNGMEFRRFTVFYRCKGVDRLVEALKNLENAEVDEKTVKDIEEKILENMGRRAFSFKLRINLKLNSFKFEFDPLEFRFRSVENPNYLAIGMSHRVVRVVANLKEAYISKLSEKVADHLKEALGVKNVYEFVDVDSVRKLFSENIESLSNFRFADIFRDFVDVVLKDFESRIVVARDCQVLKYLRRFKGIVFVLNCPNAFDEILKRIELSQLGGRELRKMGYTKEDVIKPEEIAIHTLRVIG